MSEPDPPADPSGSRIHHLEETVRASAHALSDMAPVNLPAWRIRTRGEPRWVVSVAVAAAIGLQLSLPHRLALPPAWLLPVVGAGLLAVLVISNPTRIDRRASHLRALSFGLTVVLSLANAASAIRLVTGVVDGHLSPDAAALLLSGGAIWLTNIIVFSLWYWELDRGGPASRAHGERPYPDFLFTQMASPDLAPPHWEPTYVDYLYLSFTNAAAFSPTDVLPTARWAKLTMMVQSMVSLGTVALVVARAINILPN